MSLQSLCFCYKQPLTAQSHSVRDIIKKSYKVPANGKMFIYKKGVTSLDGLNEINGIERVRELTIMENPLSVIPPNIFGGMVNLRSLNLAHNNIAEIPPNTFDNLINLERLTLSYNQIEYLPQNIFDTLHKLTHLRLRNNYLEVLPVLDNLTSLQTLDLIHNNLTIESFTPNMLAPLASTLHLLKVEQNKIQGVSSQQFGPYIGLGPRILPNGIITGVPFTFYPQRK